MTSSRCRLDRRRAVDRLPVRWVLCGRGPGVWMATDTRRGRLIVASCEERRRYGSTERTNNAEIVDYHGTRNLIEQATAADVELVVFISTIYASRPEHYQDVEPTSLGWKARAKRSSEDLEFRTASSVPAGSRTALAVSRWPSRTAIPPKAGSHEPTSPRSARSCCFSPTPAERRSRWSRRRQGRRRASRPP
jgi:hypothetical protein